MSKIIGNTTATPMAVPDVDYMVEETVEISQNDSPYVFIKRPSAERHEVTVTVYAYDESPSFDSCWIRLGFGGHITPLRPSPPGVLNPIPEDAIRAKEFTSVGNYVFTFVPHDYPEFMENLSDIVKNTISVYINFSDSVKATIETCDVRVSYKRDIEDVVEENIHNIKRLEYYLEEKVDKANMSAEIQGGVLILSKKEENK